MDDRVTRAAGMLGLRRVPIRIGFVEAPPAALGRWSGGPVAAGCVFWDRAMEGKSFYTLPADHWNCAVGTHVHRIRLPDERAAELGATVSFMVETRYLDPAEVSRLPALEAEPAVIAYAPASSEAFPADVVLMAVNPAQATLAYEAGLKAGIARAAGIGIHRPSCAVLPESLRTDAMSISFGCRGNRTFTGLPDEEMYVAVPGRRWDEFVDRLVEVQRSNLTIGNYYQAQAARLTPGK
jgi:uncharacterized protein (DUF169 family)